MSRPTDVPPQKGCPFQVGLKGKKANHKRSTKRTWDTAGSSQVDHRPEFSPYQTYNPSSQGYSNATQATFQKQKNDPDVQETKGPLPIFYGAAGFSSNPRYGPIARVSEPSNGVWNTAYKLNPHLSRVLGVDLPLFSRCHVQALDLPSVSFQQRILEWGSPQERAHVGAGAFFEKLCRTQQSHGPSCLFSCLDVLRIYP